MDVKKVYAKIEAGERISFSEGVLLFEQGDLYNLGRLANLVRRRLHPENIVTFVVDRNVNYTNICSTACKFCAFYRPPGHPEGYVLSLEEIFAKIEELVNLGGTQLLMQGGTHPDLGLEYFKNLFSRIKKRFPSIQIHSLSPPEIVYLAKKEGLSVIEVLKELKESGLQSLPGGGAEILSDRVRKEISPNKISAAEWLEVMETAHSLGMKTTATMMFGHVENYEDRIIHLENLRQLQDKTRGFTAFIPWSFQPANTALAHLLPAGGMDYLKTVAISRIYLDNFPNIQASWVTQGAKIAQLALYFGTNDFGSTMLEENVVRAAGVTYRIPMNEIIKTIREAGFIPAKRNTHYEILEVYEE